MLQKSNYMTDFFFVLELNIFLKIFQPISSLPKTFSEQNIRLLLFKIFLYYVACKCLLCQKTLETSARLLSTSTYSILSQSLLQI